MLTNEELQAIAELEERATKGPWFIKTDSCDCGDGYGCSHRAWGYELYRVDPEPDPEWGDMETKARQCLSGLYQRPVAEDIIISVDDGEFCATARTNIPALLAHITEQAETIGKLRDVIRKSTTYRYQTCDGTWCTGCWKDLARDTLAETAAFETNNV